VAGSFVVEVARRWIFPTDPNSGEFGYDKSIFLFRRSSPIRRLGVSTVGRENRGKRQNGEYTEPTFPPA